MPSGTASDPGAAPRRWPWLVAGVGIASYYATALVDPNADIVWYSVWAGFVTGASLVGALLMIRARGNRVGPILLGAALMLSFVFGAGLLAVVGSQTPGVPRELVLAAAMVNQAGFIVPIVVVLIGIPLIFPDGRLLSKRWRWLVVLAVGAVLATVPSNLVRPGPVGPTDLANPLALDPLPPVIPLLESFSSWTSIIGFGGAALAVVLRYRRGGSVERHQLKWLIAVAAVAAVAFPVAFLVPQSFAADIAFLAGLVALVALPIVIGIAILRYRLYEIDRIVSRTLSWAVVSGVLVAVFAALVLGLQAALDDVTQGQTLAVAASTLAAVALFQPLRRRVQRAVDRRFDRARYDAHRTAETFAARLRDEVDLGTVQASLTDLVEGSLRPVTMSVWLRAGDDGR
jgi:hypothetical protein